MRPQSAVLVLLLVSSAACEKEAPDRAWRFVQQQAAPGPLASSHASLSADCAACHTPLRGVEAGSCITCHALNGALVERQTTAFHANVGECAGCHIEHAGAAALLGPMDHQQFAGVVGRAAPTGAVPRAQDLDCMRCHERQDPHAELLGRDCASCHVIGSWTIAAYRHPSAKSRDCAQCHAPPPSHYMEHFEMVSARVARQEHANVTECYRCHLTTRWNDIRGVGFYDHH